MELIDFIKKAIEKTRKTELESKAWKMHVMTFEELTKENNDIEIKNAWNEVSYEYSELMAELRKINEFIETWQTLEK